MYHTKLYYSIHGLNYNSCFRSQPSHLYSRFILISIPHTCVDVQRWRTDHIRCQGRPRAWLAARTVGVGIPADSLSGPGKKVGVESGNREDWKTDRGKIFYSFISTEYKGKLFCFRKLYRTIFPHMSSMNLAPSQFQKFWQKKAPDIGRRGSK